jgi:hypothetical protein
MASVGSFTFPARNTAVDVQTRFVEGRTRKVIRVDTILLGSGTLNEFLSQVASLEGEIDKFDRGEAALSITAGRYSTGRRMSLQRTLDEVSRFAAFEIRFLTNDRFERSTTLHETSRTLTASGDTLEIIQEGNAESRPLVIIFATGNLVKPAISDGQRTLTLDETLPPWSELTIDCENRTAVIDGTENVLNKTAGVFPLLSPGTTTLTYTDDPSSSHSGSLTVKYRDTWV